MPFLDPERRKALLVGGAIILTFAVGLVALWGLGYVPGVVGTTFSLITGFLWTPLIMEPLLFIAGLFAVLILNHHRKVNEGEEIVVLETSESAGHRSQDRTDAPIDDSATLTQEQLDALTVALENAAETGDHKEVMRLMLEIPDAELDSEEVIAIRLQLAIANRDPNHIRGLTRKLHALNPEHPLLAKKITKPRS